MWAAALPLGAIISAAATPRRHLVGVGRREMGMGEGGDAQKQQLSGSDILMALQRATANKLKDKADDNDAAAARARGNQQHSTTIKQQQQQQQRPLCINPQWAHQLEQLETRLHHLPPHA